jgi:hypothetical protein
MAGPGRYERPTRLSDSVVGELNFYVLVKGGSRPK